MFWYIGHDSLSKVARERHIIFALFPGLIYVIIFHSRDASFTDRAVRSFFFALFIRDFIVPRLTPSICAMSR